MATKLGKEMSNTTGKKGKFDKFSQEFDGFGQAFDRLVDGFFGMIKGFANILAGTFLMMAEGIKIAVDGFKSLDGDKSKKERAHTSNKNASNDFTGGSIIDDYDATNKCAWCGGVVRKKKWEVATGPINTGLREPVHVECVKNYPRSERIKVR